MPRAEYLVQLPSRIGNVITEGVREFANNTGLKAEVWVHDLPLWFVSQVDAGAGIIRRIQVGVYRLDTSEEIRMVPQVLRLDTKNRRLIAFEEVNPKIIRSLRLDTVQDKKVVITLLGESWGEALRMEPPPGPAATAPPGVISIHVSPNYDWE